MTDGYNDNKRKENNNCTCYNILTTFLYRPYPYCKPRTQIALVHSRTRFTWQYRQKIVSNSDRIESAIFFQTCVQIKKYRLHSLFIFILFEMVFIFSNIIVFKILAWYLFSNFFCLMIVSRALSFSISCTYSSSLDFISVFLCLRCCYR